METSQAKTPQAKTSQTMKPHALVAHPDNAIVWHEDQLFLLDQRALPAETRFVVCENAAETARAIKDMVVRGAPAIGVTAAYGVVLSVRDHFQRSPADWRPGVDQDLKVLA
ncbi:MAG: hypothetical protein K9L65_06700, partial [Chromatiaceae bacterium]|nr:hypothetical protein [Chromatiaceae bacterium]